MSSSCGSVTVSVYESCWPEDLAFTVAHRTQSATARPRCVSHPAHVVSTRRAHSASSADRLNADNLYPCIAASRCCNQQLRRVLQRDLTAFAALHHAPGIEGVHSGEADGRGEVHQSCVAHAQSSA